MTQQHRWAGKQKTETEHQLKNPQTLCSLAVESLCVCVCVRAILYSLNLYLLGYTLNSCAIS